MNYSYQDLNGVRQVHNPRILSRLYAAVGNTLTRNITDRERKIINKVVRNTREKELTGKNQYDMFDYLLSKSLSAITAPKSYDIDIKELLKTQIGSRNETGGVKRTIVNLPPGGEKSVVRNYINLDSKYRTLDTDGTETMSWNIVSNSLTRQQGSANIQGNVRDLIGMRIYNVTIPLVATANNDMKKITMLIQEFKAQSIIGHENRQYHFIGDSIIDGQKMIIDFDKNNRGRYYFHYPFTTLNTITLSFGNPLQPVIFSPDRASSTISSANPAVVTSDAHGLSNGDIVNFTDYNTVPLVPSVINAVNAAGGLIISNVTANTFEIPVDTSGAVSAGPIVVYFNSRRIFITLELMSTRSE